MKQTRSVRFTEDLLKGVSWVQEHQGGDTSDAVRRLLRKGLERELADLYSRGKITLREMAQVLSVPLRHALDVLRDQGVTGNVTSDQSLDASEVIEKLSGSPPASARRNRGRRSKSDGRDKR